MKFDGLTLADMILLALEANGGAAPKTRIATWLLTQKVTVLRDPYFAAVQHNLTNNFMTPVKDIEKCKCKNGYALTDAGREHISQWVQR